MGKNPSVSRWRQRVRSEGDKSPVKIASAHGFDGESVAKLLHNRGVLPGMSCAEGAHMKVRTVGLGIVLAGFTLVSVPALAQDPKGGGGAPGGGASERTGGGGAAANNGGGGGGSVGRACGRGATRGRPGRRGVLGGGRLRRQCWRQRRDRRQLEQQWIFGRRQHVRLPLRQRRSGVELELRRGCAWTRSGAVASRRICEQQRDRSRGR